MAGHLTEVVDIADVLEKCREGKTKHLNLLMSQLRDASLPNDILLKYLQDLRLRAMELGKDFEILVGFLLKIEWTSRPPDVVDEYMLVVKNLVSAHTFYLSACLKMIVDNFKPRRLKPGEAVTDEVRLQHSDNFVHLHSLLCAITKIVPMTPIVLVPLLASNFPFYMVDEYSLECYLTNLLNVTEYLTQYRCHILKLIFAELTKIDVHMPHSEDTETLKDEKSTSDELVIMSKLDVLMELLLCFIKRTCHSRAGELNLAASQKLLQDILDVFEVVILPTYASRSVQFVVFYICSFAETLAKEFLDRLWRKFEDPNIQVVFRQSAVLYIASYLVRAAHISIETVKSYMGTLVEWVRSYIKLSPQSSHPDAKRHRPFYTASQAIFYIFVHRHEELIHNYGLKYCENLYLGTLVTCWLNPLRFCLPHIATKFAAVVRNNRIAFCDTVLEKNRRCHLPEADSGIDHYKSLTYECQLDSHFPFEPCCLKRSREYIADKYRHIECLLDDRHHRSDRDTKEAELYMEVDDVEVSSSNIDLYTT